MHNAFQVSAFKVIRLMSDCHTNLLSCRLTESIPVRVLSLTCQLIQRPSSDGTNKIMDGLDFKWKGMMSV